MPYKGSSGSRDDEAKECSTCDAGAGRAEIVNAI